MDPEPTGAKAASPVSEHDERVEPADTRVERAIEAAQPARRRPKTPAPRENAGTVPNNVKRLRQAAMMSKAELARRAGVSPLTIDRVEAGCPCRMDTKRKILEALGLQPSAAQQVFPDEDLG
ncbi:MAG: helix-turn-helix domain-containing protein [Deltaproteobacteria bacterium]|nr:helix-turn-helix domain-containing protein [Nannocystaceae bacterium]